MTGTTESSHGLANYLNRPKSVIPPLLALLVFLFGLAGFAALAYFMPLWGDAAKSKEALDLNPWLKFFARFHVLVVHLPLGILALLVVLEMLSWFRSLRPRLIDGIFVSLWVAGLSGIVGVTLGWLLTADTGKGDDPMLRSHLYWTIGAVLGILLATFFRHVNERASSVFYAGVYKLILLGVLVAVSIGGHSGANLVHGPTYLTRNLPPELEQIMPAFLKGEKEAPQEESQDSPQAQENAPEENETSSVQNPESETVFASLILPALEQKCNECHSEDKTKGRLRMDQYDLLMAGGAEENSTVIPGDAENSLLLVRSLLPEDDDERMPPDQKPSFTDKEISIISWWIKNGASDKVTLAEARQSPDFPQL